MKEIWQENRQLCGTKTLVVTLLSLAIFFVIAFLFAHALQIAAEEIENVETWHYIETPETQQIQTNFTQ